MEFQKLTSLTVKEYKYLLEQDLLYEFYPEATGNYKKDLSQTKDWKEDFVIYETGNYYNKCMQCGDLFVGDKIRRTCKVCASEIIEISRIEYENFKKIEESYNKLLDWLSKQPKNLI